MSPRIKALLVEYGVIAWWVYFSIFFAVLGGFALAIQLGLRPESVSGDLGLWAGAYLATKLTQPLRIAATVLLTPLVAKLPPIARRRARAAAAAIQDSAPTA